MKPLSGRTITMLVFGVSLCVPVAAQQAGGGRNDEKEPEAMEALNRMGTYLRSLKAFQVLGDVTAEDVLTDGEKVQFAHRTNVLGHRKRVWGLRRDGPISASPPFA